MPITDRIAGLSPEKRALLLARLGKAAYSRQAIPKRASPGPFRLSFAQQRLWFLNQFEPDSPVYNLSAALRLEGSADAAILECCLDRLVRRHEALRTCFEVRNGEPVQIISSEVRVALTVTSLEALPEKERRREVERLATEEARRPFDLARGPLFRFGLIRLGGREHVLLVTLHHIVADGWSVALLIRELAGAYNALSSSREPSLPQLPIQYADFAEWQRSRPSDDPAIRASIEYWKVRLAAVPPLALRPDRPRPAVQSYRGAHHRFTLPAELSQAVSTAARLEGVTPFMLLLAAFQALLSRYAGQQDIAVGTPVANRSRAELESLVGFFVNTLVIRSHIPPASTFRQLLRQVRDAVLEAEQHQEVPFDLIVDEVQPVRDPSRTPLFQAAFLHQRDPFQNVEGRLGAFSILDIETGTAKFDLLLMTEETNGGIRAVLEYNTDLFDSSTIETLSAHFVILLRGALDAPDLPVAGLPLLSPTERRQIVTGFNPEPTAYPAHRCVHELFEDQARLRPESVAVVFSGERLTYGELNRRADELAARLRGLGVGPEVVVGVLLERSVEMVVALLGILKAGGAYLPLDPAYPAERLEFMLADSAAAVVIDRAGLHCRTAPSPSPQPLSPANLAYVMYTSGSTGVPKGSQIPHQAIVRLLFGTSYVPFGPDLTFLQLGPVAFDASTFEIWGALLHGGRCVLYPDRTPLPDELGRLIQKEGVTTAFLTTALFNALIDEAPQILAPFKHLLVGGEAASVAHVRRAIELLPGTRIINAYGPTESTTFTTVHPVAADPGPLTTVPIGRPIGNTRVHILDGRFEPVPVGVPGELYIGGDGLARGYLARPDLTAERFVPDPFSTAAGARLYRSGDRARYLPNGDIEFLERLDHQVKIRGRRIELGEIEAALRSHADVKDAVTLAREDTPGDKRLVAYVVSSACPPPSSNALRAYLERKLPEYMVPSAFLMLDSFPLNPNGKVDRRALPAPDRTELTRKYMAPRTPLERRLAGMWGELLNTGRVGVYDNFFELGGNSIQAAIFTNRLQEQLGATSLVRALFMAPTVAELAAYLREYYPEAAARLGGSEQEDQEGEFAFERQLAAGGRVDESKLNQMRKIIPPLPPFSASLPKNPRALFVLSPPRSGSTLLRAMLAGHPKLFSPPELDLLSFNTLQERRAAFSGRHEFWLEGPIRALMEIQGCDADKAAAIMAELEGRNLSTKQFYRQLQEWIGDRLLVDKTPVYPLDLEILKRAERDFDNPLYIHLIRHPYASVYSFVEAKLDQVFFRYPHPFSMRELAELVWIVCHQNILAFLSGLPAERQCRISYEDLVRSPREVMDRVCGLLGIEFSPAMLEPYQGGRMTDGVRPGAQMVGDFKFYLRKKIDPNAAERWKRFHGEDFLGDAARALASELGYAGEETPAGNRPGWKEIPRAPRDSQLPLSFAQQRLWFLDQLEPGSAMYNVAAAVRLRGPLNTEVLNRSLNEIVRRHEVLRTRFVSQNGRAVQVIEPERQLDLAVIELSGLPEAEREAEAMRRARVEAARPFDLASGPLLRGTLIRLAPRDHLAVLVLHHIVADGWSAGVLLREVSALYTAFVDGQPSPLSELPVQYADYAVWQRNSVDQETLDRDLTYWKQQLADSSRLELPLDRPRPAIQTGQGAAFCFDWPLEALERVRAFSRRQSVTPFMTLLAAFKALLCRYSGQCDISVGTPVASRNRAEIEPLIGFFANTLVLRTSLEGDPTFSALLARVRDVSTEAHAHQDVPFERLVEEIGTARDLSTTPLFEVMFALQNASLMTLELPGVEVNRVEVDSGASKFDLTLILTERPNCLRATFEYAIDLFDRSTIERLAAHYRNLLEAAVAAPETRLAELPLLSPAERQRLLVEFNDTAADLPQPACFPTLFEQQVARTPDRPAVACSGRQLTYRELNQQAEALARRLRQLGVGPEVLVGLCVERSLETVVGVVGILKAGGAYLPLDPGYPSERLAYMLEDSRAAVLVTHSALEPDLPAYSGPKVYLDQLPAEPDAVPLSPVPLKSENLAYVIYTSGSTGRPKGVLIEHRSMINLAVGLERAIYSRHASDGLRVSLNAPLSFDASVQQLVMLLRGRTVEVLPEEVRRDGALLREYLSRAGVEGLDCVPSQLKLLLEAGLLEGGAKPQVVLPGGEAIDGGTWKILAEAEGVEFYNMYGPTECTVDTTVCRAREQAGRVSIGGPLANARLYVLDGQLRPVPMGVAGELHIGGLGVGRGYLGRPELTAERFIPDPYSGVAGARMYRSGDRVRWLGRGQVEFLGRVDGQVKLRGYRIELGEIEAVVGQQAGVKAAAVAVREERLVGYVVWEEEREGAIAELRAGLRRQLPEPMVPGTWVVLEALPLTPNGKVDRRALPAPGGERPEMGSAYVGPRSEAEAVLAGIWASVLGLERVGVEDNFFELGGDSILSIQVVARANQAGLRVSPKQLFQHPTVARLAEVAGKAGSRVAAEQGVVEGEVPPTPIQRWFFEQGFAEPQHYNQSVLLEVGEELERGRLERALGALLAHHDALRLRVTNEGGLKIGPVDGQIPLEWVERAGEEELAARVAAAQASLNLEEGPLVRALYCKEPRRLLLVIHHLAVDGVSWRILLEDFQRAYEGQPLPPKTTSFKQWAERLQEYAGSNEIGEELQYWLRAHRAARLPVDMPGGRNTEASASSITASLSEEDTETLLREAPAALGTEINALLLTALAGAFRQWTGNPALLINLEGHGREDSWEDLDVTRTAGWFTTIFPVRLEAESADPLETLRAVNDQLRRIPNRGIGYGLLRYLCDPENTRRFRALPQPEVSFNYLGQFGQEPAQASFLRPTGGPNGPMRSGRQRRAHLIDVTGGIAGGRLRLEWIYSRELHEADSVRKIAEAFLIGLGDLAAAARSTNKCAGREEPAEPVSDLDAADLDVVLGGLA